ncbi:MAG: AarF/UbiB family protein [Anaerolineales bacterium]|jgi:predicted unusual protein kinase regulating ubiquinone biosynthesis (AarF/ABC1/UbiB family)|nr:AarF/UbiB family protein [Anaerolineales bacterium]
MLRARYRRITWHFFRVLLSLFFWELLLPRLGLKAWVRRTRSERLRRIAVRFRAMAVGMGGVLIKVGQFLSSRVDVMPPEITRELEGLQDEVPAESFDAIRRIAESELGATLAQKFDTFDPQPLAAASLGQVHTAKLHSPGTTQGEQMSNGNLVNVVVKIQRPQIEQIIAIDLSAIRKVGQWVRLYRPVSRRANIPALIGEFSRTLYEEIDYLAEGRNAETFAANFKDEPGVLVPRVVWTHTTRRVLTLEDVGGIKITDYDQITAVGIDRHEVANRLLNTYLKQIFEDGFFHADPHPGNLFVRLAPANIHDQPGKPAWQLTFVDFGMVGRITPQARAGMRDMLIGIGTRDTDRVLTSFKKLGFLLPGADLELLRKAEQEMFDRFWGKSMNELIQVKMEEMVDIAYAFRDLLYDLPFQIPQDIIFLGRAVGILSGMCTGLAADFNLWEALAPYSKKLVADEGIGSIDRLLEEIGKVARRLVSLPVRAETLLGKLEHGELVTRDPQLARQVEHLEGAIKQAANSVVFAALLIGAVQFYLAGQTGLAVALSLGSGLALLGVFRRRS